MSIGAIGDGVLRGMFQCISPGVNQVLNVNGTSNQSALPQSGVSIIRLFSTVDCWISFGTNPTAAAESAGSMFLPGGIIEYFEIRADEKLAVIQNGTGTGKLYLTEGADR